jgi:hypothetical protein
MAQLRQERPGMTDACADTIRFGGFEALSWEVDRCFKMTPSRRWSGTWQIGFERSEFCADGDTCRPFSQTNSTWLSSNVKMLDGDAGDGTYRVEFIGRRTQELGVYGHMNGYGHHIIVDRLVSIHRLQN